MFLTHAQSMSSDSSFLRASGGVSSPMCTTLTILKFSPRKRRCFYSCSSKRRIFAVFSAQAEVFLSQSYVDKNRQGFLRASGGVSWYAGTRFLRFGFSPRKRRCFWLPCGQPKINTVFSAQAEVFLSIAVRHSSTQRFLRASGGVSF